MEEGQGGEECWCHMMAPGSMEMSLQREEQQLWEGGDSLGAGNKLAF